MWQTIAQWAVKVALYAAEHPDKVKAIVDDVVAIKKATGGTAA